jgi:hypothetical protein
MSILLAEVLPSMRVGHLSQPGIHIHNMWLLLCGRGDVQAASPALDSEPQQKLASSTATLSPLLGAVPEHGCC